jgi:hypothetical protein
MWLALDMSQTVTRGHKTMPVILKFDSLVIVTG